MLPGIKLFDLTGQVAIVTGGSKGLGRMKEEGGRMKDGFKTK